MNEVTLPFYLYVWKTLLGNTVSLLGLGLRGHVLTYLSCCFVFIFIFSGVVSLFPWNGMERKLKTRCTGSNPRVILTLTPMHMR